MNQKKKGNRYELAKAKQLTELLGIEFERQLFSGSIEGYKGDLIPKGDEARRIHPWCYELKNQQKLKIPEWIRQTEREAAEMGKKPILMFHMHGTSDDFVVLRLEDWAGLVNKAGDK